MRTTVALSRDLWRFVRNRVDEEPEEEEAEPDFEDEAAAEEFRQRKVRCAA